MNEKQEIIARALEIAVILTKADASYLSEDEYNIIHMKRPLYKTLKMVLRVINTENLADADRSSRIICDF